jgi:hypothetical protein
MSCSKRIAAVRELSDSARLLRHPWHGFPAIIPHEISDDSKDASATGEAAGFNPSPDDVGIPLDDDTWARQ